MGMTDWLTEVTAPEPEKMVEALLATLDRS